MGVLFRMEVIIVEFDRPLLELVRLRIFSKVNMSGRTFTLNSNDEHQALFGLLVPTMIHSLIGHYQLPDKFFSLINVECEVKPFALV